MKKTWAASCSVMVSTHPSRTTVNSCSCIDHLKSQIHDLWYSENDYKTQWLSLQLYNSKTERVNYYKYLGLTLDELDDQNMTLLYAKAASHLYNRFKTTRPYLCIAQSKIVVVTLLQPILDHADSVWSHCSSAKKKFLQVIQHKGIKIIFNTPCAGGSYFPIPVLRIDTN